MSTPARRRLMRDFKRLQDDPPVGVSGAPTDNNIMLWNAVIFGLVYYIIRIYSIKSPPYHHANWQLQFLLIFLAKKRIY